MSNCVVAKKVSHALRLHSARYVREAPKAVGQIGASFEARKGRAAV
jgi:hypothetical protein